MPISRHRGSRPAAGTKRAPDKIAAAQLAEALRLYRSGDIEGAAERCDALIALYPDDAEVLHLGGVAAGRLGRHKSAVDRLRRAATLRPHDPEMINDFGWALELSGNRSGAEGAYRAALLLRPDFAGAQLNLARLLDGLGRDGEAAASYEALLERQPGLAEAHSRLSQLQLKLMLPGKALASAQRALALKPELVEAHAALGTALDTLGRFDEAIVARDAVIRLRPADAGGYYDRGMTQMHHGRLADAEASLRQAVALEPLRGNWHRALSMLVGHKERGPDIAAMERVLRSNSANDDDRMHVYFGLGKALDDLGAVDEAFNYFLEGNRLKRAHLHYSTAETDRLFGTMKAVFTPELFAARKHSGSPDPTPIFVLGMPRSGTSLVEQVLASHPAVQGGGEFRLINQLVGALAPGPGFPIGEALAHTNDKELREMGERYVAQVRGLSADARFITDKLPGNFIMIGMIRLMLPNAKIIHCRRDPVDNCLSLFKNYFAAEHLRYAYDLTEIGNYYVRYLDLMEHWHRVLPGFVYDVSYEGLTGDFEAEGQKLLARCGLDWRDECRQFFNTRRSVQTASAVQVRQPIYRTSVGQAARYGDRLAPLLQALGR